jgi:tetratricopeptide (TPR) repeat protein
MIVKNEEAVLGKCLSCVRKLVDEMIVVDTGSSDGTIAIAEDFGARVYRHLWENDFGKHRNQALEYAKGEWILVMDADEVIASRDIEKIEKLVSRPGAYGYSFILRNYERNPNLANLIVNPGDYEEECGFPGFIPVRLIRLFRNTEMIRFSGAVHETVNKSFEEHKLSFVDTSIPIHHYGKVMEGRLPEKANLYRLLGEEKIRRQPDNPSAYKGLADQYLESGMPDKAIGILSEGIARFPDLAELRFDRGQAMDRLGRYGEAETDYAWVLEKMPGHTGACHNLARILLDENNVGRAVFLLKRGVEAGIGHPAVFFLLGRALSAAGCWEEALYNFDRVLEVRPGYRNAHLGRAFVFLNAKRYDDAMRAIEGEIEVGGDRASAYNMLGEMCLTFGDTQSAGQFFRSALAIEPGHSAAKNHLATI